MNRGTEEESRPEARAVARDEGLQQGEQMSPESQRSWATLAHLSAFANLITGVGGIVAALIVYLMHRSRSETVAFHAVQSLWYQVLFAVLILGTSLIGVLITIVVVAVVALMVGFSFELISLASVISGIVAAPVSALLGIALLVNAAYAAYKTYRGEDYHYPIVGGRVARSSSRSSRLSQ